MDGGYGNMVWWPWPAPKAQSASDRPRPVNWKERRGQTKGAEHTDDSQIYEYSFSVMEFPCFDVVLCGWPLYNVQRLPH